MAFNRSGVRSRNNYPVQEFSSIHPFNAVSASGPYLCVARLATEGPQVPSGFHPESLRSVEQFPFPYSSDPRTSFVLSPGLGVSSERLSTRISTSSHQPMTRYLIQKPADSPVPGSVAHSLVRMELYVRRNLQEEKQRVSRQNGIYTRTVADLHFRTTDYSPCVRTGKVGEDLDASCNFACLGGIGKHWTGKNIAVSIFQ